LALSKDSLKILKLANKNETINLEDACMAVYGSVHSAYAPEHLGYLEKKRFIVVTSEMMPEGYERTTIRITPEGQAELEVLSNQKREAWITRGLSISAIVLSAISLTWQILSATTPK